MGFLGPFDTDRLHVVERYTYWTICIVGVGLGGAVADEASRRFEAALWQRVLAVSVCMTPPGALLVLTTQHFLMGEPYGWPAYLKLLWQVCPILLLIVAIRALVRHPSQTRVETRTVIASPLPEAEAVFRRRLSAKRRDARLIAIEAYDHYLKVHTDMGTELITLRFVDALEELAQAHGWRTHRSWWVTAAAVENVSWRRGLGEVRLIGGLKAPVSRTYAPILKDAGWF